MADFNRYSIKSIADRIVREITGVITVFFLGYVSSFLPFTVALFFLKKSGIDVLFEYFSVKTSSEFLVFTFTVALFTLWKSIRKGFEFLFVFLLFSVIHVTLVFYSTLPFLLP